MGAQVSRRCSWHQTQLIVYENRHQRDLDSRGQCAFAVYTRATVDRMESDLRILNTEHGI
jgi:hypothetical protein